MRTISASMLITAVAASLVAGPARAQDATTSPTTAPTNAAKPSAEQMLDAIRAVKGPKFDPSRREDQAYIREYSDAARKAMGQQADLILEFVKAYPQHEDARNAIMSLVHMTARLDRPIDPLMKELLALPLNDEVKFAARTMEVQALLNSQDPDLDAAMAKLEAMKRERPKDEDVAQLAAMIAQQTPGDLGAQRLRAVVADYPDTAAAAMAAGTLRKREAVGKPVELSFTEATSGKPIDLQKDLKGKVVVLDFWATWCGPCVAEMPHMKELYAKFQPQGVEFVGVSLDQSEADGGKAKLLQFVKANDVRWPQYYQGDYWNSAFSKGWGIDSIPAVFVVDADGKLVTTEARGELEKLLPELIAKRDAKSPAK